MAKFQQLSRSGSSGGARSSTTTPWASPGWLPSLPCAVGRSGGDDSGISIASAKLGEVRDLLGGALFLLLFEGLREEGPVFCLSAEPQDFDRERSAPVPLASCIISDACQPWTGEVGKEPAASPLVVYTQHHDEADPDFGSCRDKELLDHLDNVLDNEPVVVKRGQHIVEVNPQGISKGMVDSLLSSIVRTGTDLVDGMEDAAKIRKRSGRRGCCSAEQPSGHRHQDWNQWLPYLCSDSVGWSDTVKFRTAPAAGSDELSFVIYGDMGKAPLGPSVEHYIQPGSVSVAKAVAKEIQTGNVDSIFHIGDISYATGFLVEWDFFLHLITPLASQVPYMTAIGNHERDYVNSASVYVTPDSGGECGVAYESYFPMPAVSKDKPWYSIEQGTVHFIVMSTEHEWSEKSEQYNWMDEDLSSVDRSRTPWVIFIGHRPMYSSYGVILPNVDSNFVASVEPLLLNYQVDLVFFGHVHNYERTCAVYQGNCKGMPTSDKSGIDVYDNNNYTAPVHVIVGVGGFSLDNFPNKGEAWSLSRISEFGYGKVHATRTDMLVQFVNSSSMEIRDQFRIVKGAPANKSLSLII
ncbi:probable inactive purple acid phosphatase 27 [Zea mays]|nr:probable inactive purple acid phosphatase 27 [Zea mays]|eukprot:XP_020400973.1 probable inactive purple acid phosphatase 27 [Zea mays]